MDILAARKKAAERAQAKKAETAQPAESSPASADAVPLAAEPGALPSAPVPEPTAAVTMPPAASPAPAVDAAAPAGENRNKQEAEDIELLSFNLSGEEYAVLVEDVREVLKTRELTRVPNAPAYILGVTSLRGTMLPVMDLCSRLGLTPAERNEKARIIVVSPDEEEVGFVVDRVHSVIRVRPDAIKPAPEHVEHGGEFLRGIVRRDDKLYIVLDLNKAVMK